METGEQRWKIDLEGAPLGSPALSVDGALYIGSFNNKMLAIDSETGRTMWEFEADNPIWAGPALDGDILYVLT